MWKGGTQAYITLRRFIQICEKIMRCKNHRSQIVGGYKIPRELSVSSGTHTGVLHVLTKHNNIDERYKTLRKFTRECQLLLRGFNYLLLYFTYLHTANLTAEVLKMPFKQKSGISHMQETPARIAQKCNPEALHASGAELLIGTNSQINISQNCSLREAWWNRCSVSPKKTLSPNRIGIQPEKGNDMQ